MTGYALHPEVFTDLDNIRQYIAEHNPDAADRGRWVAAEAVVR